MWHKSLCFALTIVLNVELGSAGIAQETKQPVIAWTSSASSPQTSISNPLVAGDMVVVGTGDGWVQARRCEDGRVIWNHEHGKRVYGRPNCDADRIYFVSERGVTAVSRAEGAFVWNYPITHGVERCIALAAKNLVLAGGYDGFLHALDAKTGALRWKASLLADAPADRPGYPGHDARMSGTLARPTGLAFDEERAYQSVFDQSRLVAVELAKGKVLWSYQADGWIFGECAVGADRIFVGSQDKSLHCLDKLTGAKRWTFATKGRIESAGTLDDDSIYVASCDGCMYRLKQADGEQLWKFDTARDARRKAIYSNPLLTKDTVYFAAGEGTVYALDRGTGEERWSLRPAGDSETFTSPESDGRFLFVVTRPTHDNRGLASLVAINPDGGAK
jgi:FOG: WD40-like repeat